MEEKVEGDRFEKLIYAYLYDNYFLTKKIQDIQWSVKINFIDDNDGKYYISETDCVILTKNGNIINLESKSGKVEGNEMKSHNYITFSTSGIYGNPILVMPVVSSEKNNVDPKFINAAKSAKQAQVELWYIDEIDDKLDKLLK